MVTLSTNPFSKQEQVVVTARSTGIPNIINILVDIHSYIELKRQKASIQSSGPFKALYTLLP